MTLTHWSIQNVENMHHAEERKEDRKKKERNVK